MPIFRDLLRRHRERRGLSQEQLAALVHGRLVGDGTISIHAARPVGEAGPGDITFIENERYAKIRLAASTNIGIQSKPEWDRCRRSMSLCPRWIAAQCKMR